MVHYYKNTVCLIYKQLDFNGPRRMKYRVAIRSFIEPTPIVFYSAWHKSIWCKFLFQVFWMLYNLSGEMTTAYKRYSVKKNKKRSFVLEALKITFLNYGPHWGCWIIFILLITWTVSLQRVLSFFLAFVILMEALQFWRFPSRHFKFIENWMELFIILLSKYYDNMGWLHKTHSSPFKILPSLFPLIFLS